MTARYWSLDDCMVILGFNWALVLDLNQACRGSFLAFLNRGFAWSRDSGTLKIYNFSTILLHLTNISLKTMLPLPGLKQLHAESNVRIR